MPQVLRGVIWVTYRYISEHIDIHICAYVYIYICINSGTYIYIYVCVCTNKCTEIIHIRMFFGVLRTIVSGAWTL